MNRPKTQFHGFETMEQSIAFTDAISEHCRERKPKEMFEDFPELQNVRIRYGY